MLHKINFCIEQSDVFSRIVRCLFGGFYQTLIYPERCRKKNHSYTLLLIRVACTFVPCSLCGNKPLILPHSREDRSSYEGNHTTVGKHPFTPSLLRDWCPYVCVLNRILITTVDIVWASTIASQIMQLGWHLICAGYCFCTVILIIPGFFSRFGVSLIAMQSASTQGCGEKQHTEILYFI